MAQSIAKYLKYNDGEGLDFNDLNNMQLYAMAQLNDLTVAEMLGDFPATAKVYVQQGRPSGAPYVSATSLQLGIVQGTIWQCTGAYDPDGSTPQFLNYKLQTADAAATATFDAGDGSNPRWDIFCIKLSLTNGATQSRDFKDATTGVISSVTEVKKRDILLETQIVKGTPGASPTEPAVPAGYAKLFAVKVNTGQTGVFVSSQIRDYRIPMNWHDETVMGSAGLWTSTEWGTWVRSLYTTGAASGSGKIIDLFPQQASLRLSRLMYLSLNATLTSGKTVKLGSFSVTGGFVSLLDISGSITNGANQRSDVDLTSNIPIWGNGLSSPWGDLVTSPSTRLVLEIASGATSDVINEARFSFVGG